MEGKRRQGSRGREGVVPYHKFEEKRVVELRNEMKRHDDVLLVQDGIGWDSWSASVKSCGRDRHHDAIAKLPQWIQIESIDREKTEMDRWKSS